MCADTYLFPSPQDFPTNSNIPYAPFYRLLEYYMPKGILCSFFPFLVFIFSEGVCEDDSESIPQGLLRKIALLCCFSTSPSPGVSIINPLTDFWIVTSVITKKLEYIAHILIFPLFYSQ